MEAKDWDGWGGEEWGGWYYEGGGGRLGSQSGRDTVVNNKP